MEVIKYDNNNKDQISNDGTVVRYVSYQQGYTMVMFNMYNRCRCIGFYKGLVYWVK